MSMVSLYLGGTDTISNTIRWALLNLATHPDVQRQCYDELSREINENGEIKEEKCHYFNAMLLENRRLFPVADTLPHQAAEPVTIRGYTYKKGTFFMGSITSVMYDQENFQNPEQFRPERYLINKLFVPNPKVCSFGVGRRNCIGQQLAKLEYFHFTANIVLNFHMTLAQGNMEIDRKVGAVLAPETFKMKFAPR